MKFTFKKEPRATGLAGVGHPNPNTTIKLAGKKVGTICAPTWQTKGSKWSVRLMIQISEDGWTWVTLMKKFNSEPEARDYLKIHLSDILKLGLHSHTK